jgi:hypothetical protein
MTARHATRLRWIPPSGLAAGHLAHGASWVLLAALGLRDTIGWSLPALAWVHTVALAWVSLVALCVLLHVIPEFCDTAWRGPVVARTAIGVFAAGSYLLVWGFWKAEEPFLVVGAITAGFGLLLYLVAAFATLISAAPQPVTRAIARALTVVLSFFAITAGLGVGMALALTHARSWVQLLSRLAEVHAQLGGVGWLSLLIMGVSMRTLGPIAGLRPRNALLHRVSGSGSSAGVVALSLGIWLQLRALEWFAGMLLAAAFVLYLTELFGVLAHAPVHHRPPQAFLAAAGVWLGLAIALGLGVLAGRPLQSAYVACALLGWIGQMVVGHLHHIGVRVLATTVRGDGDETQPGELLAAPLSWATFGLFQAGVALTVLGAAIQLSTVVIAAGMIGLAGWLIMTANVLYAWRMAQHQPGLTATAGLW